MKPDVPFKIVPGIITKDAKKAYWIAVQRLFTWSTKKVIKQTAVNAWAMVSRKLIKIKLKKVG